jgi:Methyltransferase domain
MEAQQQGTGRDPVPLPEEMSISYRGVSEVLRRGDRMGAQQEMAALKREAARVLRRLGLRKLRKKARDRARARAHLLKELPVGSVGAEIGVWKGDFSRVLLDHVQPKELHLIDPWRFFDDPDHAGSFYGGAVAKGQGDMDAIYESVVARFDREINCGVVRVHREMSVDAATAFDDASFDWVYVDGDHTYDAVKSDLELYRPKVKPGGLICGDDYGSDRWPGVARAVDENVKSAAVDTVWIEPPEFVLRRTA